MYSHNARKVQVASGNTSSAIHIPNDAMLSTENDGFRGIHLYKRDKSSMDIHYPLSSLSE